MSRHAMSDFASMEPVRPDKPMLSRVAESVYWMAIYVERAEHIARMINVNWNVLIDVGDVGESLEQNLWRGVLRVLHLDQSPEANAALESGTDNMARRLCRSLTFDAANPSSLISCVTKARENARSIREIISAEMWEALNVLYWAIKGDDAHARFEESPQDMFHQIMSGSFLFQGLTNQTIQHDQAWLFAQLGKHMERCDMTCRIIETKHDILRAAESELDEPTRNIHWMAVLRSCCSINEYRRAYPGHMEPARVASFLILAPHFPRSVAYSVRHAHDAASRIRSTVNPHTIEQAERILGRLNGQLTNADPSELTTGDLSVFLRNTVAQIRVANEAIYKAYFLR
jgi:uncharacterized alpha-E superfamily protein